MRNNGWIPILILFVLFFLLGMFSGRKTGTVIRETREIVKTDTVYVIDTFTIEKPVPKYVEVVRHDTLRTEYWHLDHDTVLVDVPIERKVFEEDSLYRAVVSGWHANLDSLYIFNKVTEIQVTKIRPAPKFSFGVTAGPSVVYTLGGNVYGGLGVACGVQYRF